MRQHGRIACQRNGQARRPQSGLVAARQRSGQGTLNVGRHIACQWSGQGSLNAGAAHRLPVEWTGLIKW
jgi:hypothetical protein